MPLSQVEQFQYYDWGRQTLYVSFEGTVTESIYGEARGGSGRLIEKRFFDNLTQYDDGNGTPSEIVRYSLDEFGRTVRIIQDADGNLSTMADQRVTTRCATTLAESFRWPSRSTTSLAWPDCWKRSVCRAT